MGLERVGEVKKRMGLQPQCPVVVVAGTNGKGSVCAYLSQIYTQAGFKVGTLTSPHLLRYNERIAINTRPVEDAAIVASFERIEAARAGISLTYFEFNTLAAVDIFIREKVDVMVLEVGLGGRLDAVNVFDADCAVVTSVDLDHQAFLGDTVEQVAFEKAGVFRSGKPAICGQTPPPESLRRHAGEIGAELLLIKRDFDFSTLENVQWSYRYHPQNSDGRTRNRNALPFPALRGAYQLSNAACALTVLECLGDRLPVDIAANARSWGLDVLEVHTIAEFKEAYRKAEASDRPTMIHIETDLYGPNPPGSSWWDVPVSGVSELESTQRAYEEYLRDRKPQRHYL